MKPRTDGADASAPSAKKDLFWISVSSLNPVSTEGDVRAELAALFGDRVKTWTFLDRMEIPRALPIQLPGRLNPPSRTAFEAKEVIHDGDFLETASIEGALLSGVIAAQTVLERETNSH